MRTPLMSAGTIIWVVVEGRWLPAGSKESKLWSCTLPSTQCAIDKNVTRPIPRD